MDCRGAEELVKGYCGGRSGHVVQEKGLGATVGSP